MWDNMIGRQVRRSSRNLLLWNAAILLGIVVFFFVSSRYWYNFFLGPFAMDREELVQLTDDSGLKYRVTVRGDGCFDSDLRQESVSKRGKRRDIAKYLILVFEDKILVVKAKMDASPTDLERRGVLDTIEPEVKQRLVAAIDAELARNPRAAAIRPSILPVMLDSTISTTKGYIALAVLIPTALINILNIFRAMSRLANPQNHPLARALMRYGDPAEVAQKIEDEYQSDDREVIGPVTFTRSWMVRPTTFGVDAKFLGDTVWAYKTVTQHYTNGVPTGKTYAANLCDIHGEQLTITLKSEEQTDNFVVGVLQRVPWTLVGYDAELEAMWKKDKPQIYAIVEERRKQLAEELRRQREAPEVDDVEEAGDRSRDEPMDAEPA